MDEKTHEVFQQYFSSERQKLSNNTHGFMLIGFIIGIAFATSPVMGFVSGFVLGLTVKQMDVTTIDVVEYISRKLTYALSIFNGNDKTTEKK